MKILFRAPNWLGDAVVSRILLYNLKGHDITVLCKENLQDVFYDFKHIAFKDKKDLFSKSIKLRKEQFDTGIVVPLSFSSAFYMYIIHPAERIGFSFEGRDIFLTKSIKIPSNWKEKHTILTQFLLLETMGIKPSIPDIYFSPSCNSARPEIHQPYITIAPFAAFGSAKEWGFENYIELSKKIFKKYGFSTVILGSSLDTHRVKSLKLPDYVISLTGKTTLMDAACIIKASRIFIGNDSGLSHLSAAMGHPTITVFGPTSPTWTKPLGIKSRYIWQPPECAPCYKRECPLKTKQCMKNVSVEMVLEEAISLLENVHQSSLNDEKNNEEIN